MKPQKYNSPLLQKLLDDISVYYWEDAQETPPLNTPLLLKIRKTKKSSYGQGATGEFIVQGYLTNDAENDTDEIHTKEWWQERGYGLCFYDYTNRLLQKLNAKNPTTIVIQWAILK